MITILDDTSVAVDTFADLQSILQGNNAYTTVYLAANITMTAGIGILTTKSEITIDGLYPQDGSGTIHTLTEYSSSDSGYTLGIRGASSISMTVQNMIIVGRNYYGILFVPEGSAYNGVSITYRNITYTGPQITYHPNGITRYIDCHITIQAGSSPINEVGEVYQVEIGGNTTINQASTSYPVFWFRGSANAPSLTILSGANVIIDAGLDFMYTTYTLDFVVEAGASLVINTHTTVCRNSSYRFKSVLIHENADVRIIQAARNGYATLYCDGAFTVNENASLYMQANYSNALPLIYFYATGASLNVNNPKSFVLYSSTANALNFRYSTAVAITTGQINKWAAATALESAGGFDDTPAYAWQKLDHSPIWLTAASTASATTVSFHNFTEEELAVLPALTNLNLGTGHVFSMGNLPLLLEAVTDDEQPISGTTQPDAAVKVSYTVDGSGYSHTSVADDSGSFSIDASSAIPVGTEITVAANIPFLITTVILAAVAVGELVLSAVPQEIAFIIRPISLNPLLFGRENADWSIVISDTRARGGAWYLYATIETPLTGENPERILPGSLIFVGDGGGITQLSTDPLLTASGESTGSGDITVSWASDRGILLQAVDRPFYNGEKYTTNISWTLTDMPI